MVERLVLVRHALPDAPAKGVFLGQTDVPLCADGQRQASDLRPLVLSFKPEACYSSPLLRARQTTDILLQHTGIPIRTDEDLGEIDFGQWEGKTFEEVSRKNARAVKRWAGFEQTFAFPKGESLGGFLARIRRVAHRLSADPAGTLLVVTHGGVVRSMICRFMRIQPQHYLLFDIAHATCAVIEVFDNKGVLSGLNLRRSGDR